MARVVYENAAMQNFYLCVCVCLHICLSVCLRICLSVCVSVSVLHSNAIARVVYESAAMQNFCLTFQWRVASLTNLVQHCHCHRGHH